MARLRVSYNSPVVLTLTLMSVVVCLLPTSIVQEWFTTHGQLDGLAGYVTLLTHVLGHANWQHLFGNITLILLVGPILEERHGSLPLLAMIIVTALVASLVDLALGRHTLGASGVVFMMILLASTANIRRGEIPLTFIACALIYLGGEGCAAVTKTDNVSHLGHLLGGLTGAGFAFLGAHLTGRGREARAAEKAEPKLAEKKARLAVPPVTDEDP